MKFTTVLSTFAIVAASLVSAQYTDLVDGASGPVQYAGTNYTVTPSPMCIGKDVCLTASGTLSTDIIEGSTYSFIGRYLGRLFYVDSNKDLCALLAASGTPCPVPAGAFNLKVCLLLRPNLPPNWPVEYQFEAINGDGGRLFAQKTTGFTAYPPKPSEKPLKAVICP
ncbi:hypothetical protein BGZ95_003962 [Linnemannia exigua]|uniref:Phosphatidylglycerol/phosphatidylinositol transfer protein n=1 Tax=Linnemannia exigua TaxID=604196 RepID=A0AAD4D417_9FUNG|nr:hypothetical protein BGZ95_003962 [Linnemannia exigua]